MVVKISAGGFDRSQLLIRQTPKNKGVWRGVKFVVNSDVEKCDWWVVLHSSGLLQEEETLCDPDHLVFASMEPPDADHPLEFLRQFSHVIAVEKNITHAKLIRKTAHTWWAGYRVKFGPAGHEIQKDFDYDFDSFTSLAVPKEKKDKFSVITSTKSFWPGHVHRLKFLEKLRRHPISAHIDFFGGGGKEIEDKLEALLPYKYHLSLENSLVEDYWTEKLADPLLGWCLPFYSGCPNIARYFPSGSYIPIDISDFNDTVQKLQRALDSNLYERSLKPLSQARHLILNDHNLFNLLSDICSEPANELRLVNLRPPQEFKVTKFKKLMTRFARYL